MDLIGFAVMFVSGAMLAAYATSAYDNFYSRIKTVALLLAGVNAFFYHRVTERQIHRWDEARLPSLPPRAAGRISILVWGVVILAGRTMSYTMFYRRRQKKRACLMQHKKNNHYRDLGIMAALSFVAMYILMYAMVNTFSDVYNNVNQVYMAGLMAAPMVVIELVVMRAMYHNVKLNALLMGGSVVIGLLLFVMIREQSAVADRQFLRSMIPHHSSAILMCRQAPIRDEEIRKLCRAITSGQQQEIDQMNAILRRLGSAR